MSRSPDTHEDREPREIRDDTLFERGMRIATPRTDDDRSVIAGVGRPATREELIAFVEQESERIRREHRLPPP